MGKRIGILKLVNYRDHPSNSMYKVLNFNSKPEADLFEKKLVEQDLWFEKDIENEEDVPMYLFAVKNREFNKVQRINFEVNAKYRQPMIKNKFARYTLVIFFLTIITIALIGYFKVNY